MSSEEHVDKDITEIMSVNGDIREPCIIEQPELLFECNISDALQCNYIYVEDFGRFYYVRLREVVSGQLFRFVCHSDVLMSFRDAIRTNTAIIKRQENNWNLYLNDGTFKIYQNPMRETWPFPGGFNSLSFVLAVAGSAQSQSDQSKTEP